jgi:hypothetical protein
MRPVAILLGSMALAGCVSLASAQAGQPTPAEKKSATTVMLPPPPPKLLPDTLDGWVQTAPPKNITDPAQLDPANAAALKEYDFVSAQTASYTREGETLSLRALSFVDLTGAYGAYSCFRQNGWPKEDIGTGATSNHNRVLFWKGATVVDATFSHISPESASEMREIADKLPVPTGSKAVAPPILSFLPQASLDAQTTHYALGPASYAGSGGVLPPSLIGFDSDAETVTANYSLTSGPATLTIIDYPTPQIAAAKETEIRAYIQAGSKAQPAWPKPLTDSDVASLEVRKSGVLVILVSGDAIPDESHRLIETVHYEAQLMSVPQPMQSEVAKTGQLLLGITKIVLIGTFAALLLGFFLGGGRAAYRLARGRPISSMYDAEFIHIDLREDVVEAPRESQPPNESKSRP